jgi:DNA-binding NarL/FixJ family response regulator
MARQLKAGGFALRFVRGWRQLLAIPPSTPDVIVVDYDAAGQSDDGARTSLSAHRLVTLLVRQLSGQPTALILQTELDFVEVEDLALAGVDAIISSRLGAHVCVEQIAAALARRRARLARHKAPRAADRPVAVAVSRPLGRDTPCATVPVLTPRSNLTAEAAFAHALPAPSAPPLSPA